jgi:hypothetical protein
MVQTTRTAIAKWRQAYERLMRVILMAYYRLSGTSLLPMIARALMATALDSGYRARVESGPPQQLGQLGDVSGGAQAGSHEGYMSARTATVTRP